MTGIISSIMKFVGIIIGIIIFLVVVTLLCCCCLPCCLCARRNKRGVIHGQPVINQQEPHQQGQQGYPLQQGQQGYPLQPGYPAQQPGGLPPHVGYQPPHHYSDLPPPYPGPPIQEQGYPPVMVAPEDAQVKQPAFNPNMT